MDNFIKLLTVLMDEIKDPSTLLKRLGTILVTVILYLLLNHTAEIGSFVRTFSSTAILQDLQAQRVINFPTVAREKAMMLYAQTKADAVFVVKYKPDGVNDYQSIIAWEGNVPLDTLDLDTKTVAKTSDLYRRQLEGFNYLLNLGSKQSATARSYVGEDIPPLRNITLRFVYTCPYFNLNNIYSGYVAIAWKEPPVQLDDVEKFSEYLARLCDPQIRALGRAI